MVRGGWIDIGAGVSDVAAGNETAQPEYLLSYRHARLLFEDDERQVTAVDIVHGIEVTVPCRLNHRDQDFGKSEAGHEAVSSSGQVESGVEALSIFRGAILNKTPYHLVTLDVAMPTLDGLVTLECIRGLEMVHRSLPKTKILMVTGTARQDVIVGSIRLGSEGYLVKPLDRTLIDAKVREIFHLPLSPEQKAKLGSGPKRRLVPAQR